MYNSEWAGDHRHFANLHELYRIKLPKIWNKSYKYIYIYKIVCLCEERMLWKKRERGGGVGQDWLMYLHNSYANTRKAGGSWELPPFMALFFVCPIQIGNFCAIIFNIFTTPEKII